MKKIFLVILLFLAWSTSFCQLKETNDEVRNKGITSWRIANALDVAKPYTTTGTNTYAISVTFTNPTYNPYSGGSTYETGDAWTIIIGTTNTSTTTSLNVNTEGVIPLKDAQGNDFAVGGLPSGSTHKFVFDGTNLKEVSASTLDLIDDAIVNGETTKAPTQNAVFDANALKQDALVSATNIKTINGSSVLGAGDLVVTTSPGGADTQVQYNDAGSLNGEADMAYNETTNTLTVDNLAVDTEIYDGTGWNGDLTVPTKDAVRDKFETLAGGGTVSNITTTSPITGGPITTTGTIAIDNAAADGTTKGAASFTAADFNATTGNISLDYTNAQTASGSLKGFLTSADWTTFNSKQDALVSATNIKTVNSTTLLGSGDLDLIDDAIVNGEAKAPSQNSVFDALALKADLASPTLTGTPIAPTAAGSTSTTQIATTAFVKTYSPKVFSLAASDESTALTTGTAKITFRLPYAMVLTAVRASLTIVQSSGSILTIDINEGGTTVLSTKITIDNNEKSSTTAVTAPVISDISLADDAEITIDIDQVGVSPAGLKITLIGY
jgi:YD repeat-containing protein